MKNAVFLPVLGLLALTGCTGQVFVAKSAASIYLTRPDTPPPADRSYQIPEHETWCYRTIADVECYAKPQDVPPSRLVNVDPQPYYPLTPEAYQAELEGMRPVVADSRTNGKGEESWWDSLF
jgi:hypothetical protein